MAYEFAEIRTSQEIFSYLLEMHELRREDAPQLYKAFTESDSVQNLVKSQGESAQCSIERYGDVIYLIPAAGNRFLGYSKAQLKKELCRSNATDRDYYLVQFAILVLLAMTAVNVLIEPGTFREMAGRIRAIRKKPYFWDAK